MITTKLQSYTLTQESIKKLKELSEQFGKSRSAIVDMLIKASVSEEESELMVNKTIIKLAMLQKILEK